MDEAVPEFKDMRHSVLNTGLIPNDPQFSGRSKLELNIIDTAVAQMEQFLCIEDADFWYDEAVEEVAENLSKKGVQISKEELCNYLVFRNKTPREKIWISSLDTYHELIMDILDALQDEHESCMKAKKLLDFIKEPDESAVTRIQSRLYECDKIKEMIFNMCRSRLEDDE